MNEMNLKLDKHFSVDKLNETEYQLKYGENGLVKFDEADEIEVFKKLAVGLNNILLEKEVEIQSYSMMMEFYQKVIADTLSDKLDDIDNMYAMKKMMTEICNSLEGLTNRLVELKNSQENGDDDE